MENTKNVVIAFTNSILCIEFLSSDTDNFKKIVIDLNNPNSVDKGKNRINSG